MNLFLGIDASTQGIKAELIDIEEDIVVNSASPSDRSLPTKKNAECYESMLKAYAALESSSR